MEAVKIEIKGGHHLPNDPLAELRDIHLPPEIGWWPLAYGWWILITALLTLTMFAIFFLVKQHRSNLYKRQALRELHALKKNLNSSNNVKFTFALNILKKTCISNHRSVNAVSKNNQDFIVFMQNQSTKSLFQNTPENINEIMYDSEADEISSDDLNKFLNDAEKWISSHQIIIKKEESSLNA